MGECRYSPGGPLTGGALIAFAIATKHEISLRWIYREQDLSGLGLFPYRYHLAATGADMAERRIMVVDDVINAGSATRETMRLLREHNATPVSISALLTPGDAPAALADHEGLDLVTLGNAPSTLWTPSAARSARLGRPRARADRPAGDSRAKRMVQRTARLQGLLARSSCHRGPGLQLFSP